MKMNIQKSISWATFLRFDDFYKDKVVKFIGAKEVMSLDHVEQTVPKIFMSIYEIINPALDECGMIMEKFDAEFMLVLIKSVLMMQSSIQNNLSKEICL